jgi:superfamily II DNA or RNA helicase
MELRKYQLDMINHINSSWHAGAVNVLAVLPTGTGKTVIFSRLIRNHKSPAVAIAHRQELVGQISVALARDGVRHQIIGPQSLKALVRRLHRETVGSIHYDPTAEVAVASVDTLIRRGVQLSKWLSKVKLWVQDEAHHILRDNKWGKAAKMFPNARGLGVTATPLRADGQGLGRDYDGLIDDMIVGPPMRSIIEQGYLTDYRIFAPHTKDLDLTNITIGKTGDYSRPQLVTAVRKSKIIGDVVDNYLKIASGKLGITFATDVKTASDLSEGYRAAGITAEVVSYKTSDVGRADILRRFKNREVLQLVNVDLFGEGFDLPAVEVVSFARPTQSYGLYVQQFGRALRPLPGKKAALIIDHVGNVVRHGLPDAIRHWTLARRDRKRNSPSDVIPVKVCPECTYVYLRTITVCPDCGFKPEPIARTSPEFVDGDLTELDPETLNRLRTEVKNIDLDPLQYRARLIQRGCPQIAIGRNVRLHKKRQNAQNQLREVIAIWGAQRRAEGIPDNESYRMFYFKYGVDVLSAQSLGAKDALQLMEAINGTN